MQANRSFTARPAGPGWATGENITERRVDDEPSTAEINKRGEVV